jgi:hypothetical protein
MSIALAVAPVIIVGSVAKGKAVAPHVELTTHVGLVQLSALIITLTVLLYHLRWWLNNLQSMYLLLLRPLG